MAVALPLLSHSEGKTTLLKILTGTHTALYPVCLNYRPEVKGQISALMQGRTPHFCAALQITDFYYHGAFQSIGLVLLLS